MQIHLSTMSASISVISFNINGTKDRDFVIDELYGSYDLLFLGAFSHCFTFEFFASKSASYCVPESSKSYWRLPFRWTSLCLQTGHSSTLPSTLLLRRIFFWLCVSAILYLYSYLPYEGYSIRSLTKFGKACGLLKNLVN